MVPVYNIGTQALGRIPDHSSILVLSTRQKQDGGEGRRQWGSEPSTASVTLHHRSQVIEDCVFLSENKGQMVLISFSNPLTMSDPM